MDFDEADADFGYEEDEEDHGERVLENFEEGFEYDVEEDGNGGWMPYEEYFEGI